LDWLLPLLPQTTHYCEPFGGSAAVLLNRKPSPVEMYNDIDGEVVNFFRVLRNQQGELIQAIGLTPFSREEFRLAAKVAISSYHCQLMDELYGNWDHIESPPKKAHSTNTRPDNKKRDRVEVLWVNYKIPNLAQQKVTSSRYKAALPKKAYLDTV
jgi:site-specific DNA-adenine methylase